MTQIAKIIFATATLSIASSPISAHDRDFAKDDSKAQSATSVGDLTLETETISEGLYVLKGKRAIGNVLVSIGEDGTFMIDDQFEVSEPVIRKAIADLGGSSPKFIINSHYHHDHAGGNAPFGEDGAIIAAHDNTRKLLASGTEIKLLNLSVPPAPKTALPVVTFANEMSLHLNGNRIRMTHLPNAHTESDIATHLIEANAIHTGDVWNYTGNFPFIDARYGGSLAGMIAGQKMIAEMANHETIIVPGHGPLANKEQLLAYTKILSDIYTILEGHAQQGDSLEQVMAAKPVDQVWQFKTGIVTQDMWLGIVYPKIFSSVSAPVVP